VPLQLLLKRRDCGLHERLGAMAAYLIEHKHDLIQLSSFRSS
jgi:hypothetical protein